MMKNTSATDKKLGLLATYGHGLPPKPKDGEEEQIVELAGQWEHPSNAYNVKSWDNIGTNKRA